MIIFDELNRALEILQSGKFKSFMYGPDILTLAKYYRSLSQSTKEVEDNVIKFCEENYPDFNETLYYEKIHSKVLISGKSSLRIFSPVPITKNEFDKIKSIKNYRYEKILFIMLAHAKYYKITNASGKIRKSINYFLKMKFSKIISLAHVSQKKNENIENILYDLGLISYNKVFDSYTILFSDTDDKSEILFEIDDMNNLLKFYPPYCLVCGEELNKRSNRNQIHNDCWIRSEKERKREVAKNIRLKVAG